MKAFVLGNYMNAHFLHVDRLPMPGESLAAKRVFQEHGGKGLNLGLGLHRLGVEVDMLVPVGRDPAGQAVTQALADEGMRTDWVLPVADQSGFGVGFIAADGANFLSAHLGANACLTETVVMAAAAAIRSSDWLLAQFEIPAAPILAAFRLAREHGVATYLNPSPWRAISPELLDLTDVLVVNEHEAGLLFGLSDPAGRQDWLERLPMHAGRLGWNGRLLVVTLGDQGSVALDASGGIRHEPAPAVAQIDATGAGDAFGAGLVFSLMRGADIAQALRFANACGALIAAREGIWAHLPTRAAVQSAGFSSD